MVDFVRLGSYFFVKRLERLGEKVKSEGLTYLSKPKINAIIRECVAARRRRSESLFVEAGCALGGSALVIASAKPERASLEVYDTFEGMPPPTERDTSDVHARFKAIQSGKSEGIDGAEYYGYRKDLYQHVQDLMRTRLSAEVAASVYLNRGLVQDTMNISRRVAFAHVDVDWYEPVLTCAERIFPSLEVGGVIVFDDYHDYGSCKNAVDDYFEKFKEAVAFDSSPGSMIVRKVKPT